MQRQLDHNFWPNLPLRVILPIIITPLNWTLIHVHICTSNNIVLAGTDEFLMPFDHTYAGNFATFHQKSPRDGGFFPKKCPIHSSFHEPTSLTSKKNISLPVAQSFCAAITILNDLDLKHRDPDSRSISHFHPIKQYKNNSDIHREESNSTLSHFLLH